jgi:GH15 family glucan-1,4-alpha-glucosidase
LVETEHTTKRRDNLKTAKGRSLTPPQSNDIGDYGMIGDLNTAALIHRDGSLDWLCFPRYDSNACFAALLGTDDNGFWRIGAAQPSEAPTRKYLPGTMVLVTSHTTETGSFTVTDFMPLRRDNPAVIRIVDGTGGTAEVSMEIKVRFAYGKAVPWARRHDHSIRYIAGPDALTLTTTAPLKARGLSTVSSFHIDDGERLSFTLSYHNSTAPSPQHGDSSALLEETTEFWRSWIGASRENYGEYQEIIERSMLTLKALTYGPTGGIVAAATTSLPEAIGGPRNWDYRYCWLRDATFTLEALLRQGHESEAIHWRDWLLRAAAGDPSQLQIMYGVAGERLLPETEIPWLSGFAHSTPVRIGNAASEQFQLDVYGELMDAFYLFRKTKLSVSEDSWALQKKLIGFVMEHWRDPDEGIWEVRGPKRHFTHSKAMAWVAMDRGIKVAQLLGDKEVPLDEWTKVRDEVHALVLAEGYNEKLGAFTQYFGSTTLDASVLLLPLVGFLEADDPKVLSTLRAIERELMLDGLILRYSGENDSVDGLPPGEGVFLACSFWYIDNLILTGEHQKAKQLFDRLLTCGNDLGLFTEEYDPKTKMMLGNFPQAFSHVGLINTARNLTVDHQRPHTHRRLPALGGAPSEAP